MNSIDDFVTIETYVDNDDIAAESSEHSSISDLLSNHLLRSNNLAPDLEKHGIHWHTLQAGDVLVLNPTEHTVLMLTEIGQGNPDYTGKAYKVTHITVHYISKNPKTRAAPLIKIQVNLKTVNL